MRFLIYVTHEYEQYIKEHRIPLHGVKEYQFPKPEFYAIDSTGKMGNTLKLSDAFGGDDTFLQLNVKVLSDESLNDAPNLLEFLNFVHEVDAVYGATKDLHKAIESGLSKVTSSTIVGNLIKKEGMNMKSLAEQRFNLDEFYEGVQRSAQDLAQDLAIKESIKMLRNCGLDNDTILVQMCQQGKDRDKVLKMLNEE